MPSKNIGIQTIARILSRSDTHSDLIEDGQSMLGTPDGSGDERSDKVVDSAVLIRGKVFVSRDPWAVKIGKLRGKGSPTRELLGFDVRIPKCEIWAHFVVI